MVDTYPSEKVVDLATHRQGHRTDAFSELETYWQTLCAGRIMPYRDEVDPRGLSRALSQIFLIERIAPGTARFRVAGQDLTGLMGMDLRGLPMSCIIRPEGRQRLSDTLKALFDEPARVELTLDGGASLLRRRVAARLVCLPLRDRTGSVGRAIGCLAASGAQARTPQRFEIVGELRRTLIGYGETAPAIPGFSVDAETEAAQRKKEERAHLQIVSSN